MSGAGEHPPGAAHLPPAARACPGTGVGQVIAAAVAPGSVELEAEGGAAGVQRAREGATTQLRHTEWRPGVLKLVLTLARMGDLSSSSPSLTSR